MASTDPSGEQVVTSQPSPASNTSSVEPRRKVSIATDPVASAYDNLSYENTIRRKVSAVSIPLHRLFPENPGMNLTPNELRFNFSSRHQTIPKVRHEKRAAW